MSSNSFLRISAGVSTSMYEHKAQSGLLTVSLSHTQSLTCINACVPIASPQEMHKTDITHTSKL